MENRIVVVMLLLFSVFSEAAITLEKETQKTSSFSFQTLQNNSTKTVPFIDSLIFNLAPQKKFYILSSRSPRM